MQTELKQAFPQLSIQFIGVNEAGQESGNSLMTQGRTLPLLQDVDQDHDNLSDVSKEVWQTTYRDVVIVDSAGVKVGVYNLTTHDLANSQYYATLRKAMVDVANNVSSWQNVTRPLDVDNDGTIAPIDVLYIVNESNQRALSDATGLLKLPAEPAPPPYLDTNGDRYVSPLDALLVINQINASSGQGEGEGPDGASGGLEVRTAALAVASAELTPAELTNSSAESAVVDLTVDAMNSALDAVDLAALAAVAPADAEGAGVGEVRSWNDDLELPPDLLEDLASQWAK